MILREEREKKAVEVRKSEKEGGLLREVTVKRELTYRKRLQ